MQDNRKTKTYYESRYLGVYGEGDFIFYTTRGSVTADIPEEEFERMHESLEQNKEYQRDSEGISQRKRREGISKEIRRDFNSRDIEQAIWREHFRKGIISPFD